MQKQDIQLQQQIEALIFASQEPLALPAIRQLISENLNQSELQAIVEQLNEEYEKSGRSFQIDSIAGGYRFFVKQEFGDTLKKLLAPTIRRKLSHSLLEVLAVIAYNQPVTRGEIQKIRGVSPDYALDRLLLRALIEVRGRADAPGKPLQYGTTTEFLDLFNLPSLKELPELREIKEILQEHEEEQSLNRLNGTESASSGNEQAADDRVL